VEISKDVGVPGSDADAPALRRKLLVDARGVTMRLTWHPEVETCVVSLWHGLVCAASFRLPISEVADLSGFLTTVLGDWSLDVLADRAAHQPGPAAADAAVPAGSPQSSSQPSSDRPSADRPPSARLPFLDRLPSSLPPFVERLRRGGQRWRAAGRAEKSHPTDQPPSPPAG
jgi:hypothetical protein